MTPRVTIAMSALNAELTVGAAIASVQAQTLRDWEMLVIDDGSTDRTVEVARAAAGGDARIRVMTDPVQRGTAKQLNQLVNIADTPVFARIDADDVAYPERLARQVEFLDENPEVDLVGSSLVVFGARGLPIGKRPAPPSHEQICARPQAGFPLFHPTWTGRIDWFRRYRYDTAAVRCEDQDLLHRSYRTSVFANLPEPLLGYREDHLRLRSLLLGLTNFTRRAAGAMWREGRRVAAAGAVGEQLAKAGLDTVAVTTRLDHRLLRHRARPLSEAEVADWRAVWSAVSAEAASSDR